MLLKWAAELKDKFSKAPAYMAKAARDKFFKRFPIAIGRISSQTGFNWNLICVISKCETSFFINN